MSESHITHAPNSPQVERREIPGFPGYLLGTDGSVLSERTGKLRGASGHCKNLIVIYKDGKRYAKVIPRLVLEVFHGPCPDGMECCHCNGDASDHRLSNLRWDTARNNMRDKVSHGTYGTKLTLEQAESIRNARRSGASGWKLAAEYGVSLNHIYRVGSGRAWGMGDVHRRVTLTGNPLLDSKRLRDTFGDEYVNALS